MTVLIIAIAVAWILFSTLLVTIACMGSSQLSRQEEGRQPRRMRARARRKQEALQTPSAGIQAAIDV